MVQDAVFSKFPILHTKRLTLREPRLDDVNDVFAIKSDPIVTTGYCTEPYSEIDQARNWIRSLMDGYAKGESIMWFITPTNDDKVIGDCVLWHLDFQSASGELGYELNRDYWGKGLASEAASEVVKFGFSEMGLNRIEADPFYNNDSSSKLLDKLGFKLEGRLRQTLLFRGYYYDELWYGLLKEEWNTKSRQ